MGFDFVRLRASDGSWDAFNTDWQAQCESFNEDFDALYGDSPIAVVRDLAVGEERADAAVYALRDEERFCALCQVNSTFLPGYDGKVLRVRMMYFAPVYDFGDRTVEEYAKLLTELFGQVLRLSDGAMPAAHVKFHLRSPGDRTFFAALGSLLDTRSVFRTVITRGAWLYITK